MRMLAGKSEERHCEVCDKSTKRQVSRGYWVEDNLYFLDFHCNNCGANLSEKDSEIVKKAEREGKKITVFMY